MSRSDGGASAGGKKPANEPAGRSGSANVLATRLAGSRDVVDLNFGDRKLVIHKGDVLDLEADALVCPVDPNLNLGAGLASLVARAAGPGAVVERPVLPEPFGKVVVLPGGKLKTKYLFLTVVLGERGPDKIRLSIQQAVDRSIRYAEFLRLRSLAFPMIGSPQTLPPYTEIANLMLQSAAQYFCRRNTKLKVILFSLYNPDAFQAFRREAEGWIKQ